MYELLPHDELMYTREDLAKILCEIQESPSTRGTCAHPFFLNIWA